MCMDLTPATSTAVPEPNSLALLSLGELLALRSFRRATAFTA
ncbi:MAG: PEP-CTERM sorting domain-containing protein [Candidatus Marinimicrobia bacterium]|nr:PEP-CTERM sorting domain-containing protein [Candidatus Neomarinimicrobiota bacterium]